MICAAPVAKGPGELPEQYNGEDHVYSTPFKHALIVSGCLTLAAFTIPATAVDPDLKPGFPVQLPHFGGSYKSGPGVHALIGNIDGDANLEILGSSNGSNPIYAIKADGTFVPGWPISNPYGMGYLGLGRLTANAGADQVFAGFWGTVEFAYDGNGNVLPGWPHVADNYISSPPALAIFQRGRAKHLHSGDRRSGRRRRPGNHRRHGLVHGRGRHSRLSFQRNAGGGIPGSLCAGICQHVRCRR